MGKSDMKKFLNKGFGLPCCLTGCVASKMGPKIVKNLNENNPDAPAQSNEVGKEFAAAMGDKKFFAGDQPGQVDIGYYGTIIPFHTCNCDGVQAHLDSSGGLSEWFHRMKAAMPDVMMK